MSQQSKIDPELVRQNGVRHATEIKAMIVGYMDALLPERMRCEVRIDPEDEGIIVLDGTPFTISPAEVAVKTFASIDHRIGWNLEECRVLRNYPLAPDDVDVTTICSATDPRTTARKAVTMIWRLHAKGLWEREDESMMVFDDVDF